MNGHRHFRLVIPLMAALAAVLFAVVALRARADVGQDPDARPQAERLALDTLAQWSPWGGELTDAELVELKPALIDYFLNGGDPMEAHAIYRNALVNGCRRACLVETFACMTEALEEGVSCAEAQEMVAEAQRVVDEALRLEAAAKGAAGARGGAEERADRVRERVEDMLAAR